MRKPISRRRRKTARRSVDASAPGTPSGVPGSNDLPVSDPALLKPAALGPADRGSQTTEAFVLRLLSFRALSKLVPRLRARAPSFHGEFDLGSGRTLAACL